MTRCLLACALMMWLCSCDAASSKDTKKKGAKPATSGAAAKAGDAKKPGEAGADKAGASATPPPLDVAAWVNSGPLTLAALGGKVVVLDFWGTFCAPCRKLMPHLSSLYDKHKPEGLMVIGVSEDGKADIEKFAKEHKVSYPLAADRLVNGDGQTLKAYGIVAIPTACLIGRDGKIVWKGDGEKLTDQMILDEIAKR